MINHPQFKISELCDVIVDCVNKTAPIAGNVTPYKMIRTPNIQDGRVVLDGCRYVEEEVYEKWTRRAKVNKDDVLLTREAPMGKVGIVTFEDTIFLGQRIMQYPANLGKLNPKFLLYSFLSPYLQNQFRRHNNSGSIVSHIRVPDCFEFQIPTPSINEQSRIAKVLSDLDAKIELNNKINEELEAMAKLIYDYWFVQFDFPDENGKTYKSSGGKMVWNKELKRYIPEGWEVKPLGDCIILYDSLRVPLARSEREKIQGYIPYYGATSVMGYVNDFLFDDDYILLAEDGSVMDEKGMPIVQFIWGKTWVNNHAHVIQAKDKRNNEFIYQLVKMIPVVLIKSGSIQMKINQQNLTKYKVLVPQDELIEAYSKKASAIRRKLINNLKENQKLAELRDWLLPMLMNGQVKVK